MKPLLAVLMVLTLAACVAPVGPVEVTRFHVPELATRGRESIAIEPAVGQDGNSLEFGTYASAVSRQLNLLGFNAGTTSANSPQVAILRIERHVWRADRAHGPVSVGLGGSTGSYGSGMGVGIGLDLSGPPPEMVETLLGVTIKDRANGKVLWEGKATFAVRATSPLASTQIGAAKLAEALFKGFPGSSGETIKVP
jgi:hypothetical protein